jgi:hypothetical protein
LKGNGGKSPNKLSYSTLPNEISIEMDSFFSTVDSFFTTIDALVSSSTEHQDVPVEFDGGGSGGTGGCVVA